MTISQWDLRCIPWIVKKASSLTWMYWLGLISSWTDQPTFSLNTSSFADSKCGQSSFADSKCGFLYSNLSSLLNHFRSNATVQKYYLKKIVEDWNTIPGDGYLYFMFRPPWVCITSFFDNFICFILSVLNLSKNCITGVCPQLISYKLVSHMLLSSIGICSSDRHIFHPTSRRARFFNFQGCRILKFKYSI